MTTTEDRTRMRELTTYLLLAASNGAKMKKPPHWNGLVRIARDYGHRTEATAAEFEALRSVTIGELLGFPVGKDT